MSMFDFLNIVAPLSPLFAITGAVIVFLRHRIKKNESGYRSAGLFILGILVVGVLFFVLGFFVGADISCKGAKYAECTLGGLLIGGPLGFTIAITAYLYVWAKYGARPNLLFRSNREQ